SPSLSRASYALSARDTTDSRRSPLLQGAGQSRRLLGARGFTSFYKKKARRSSGPSTSISLAAGIYKLFFCGTSGTGGTIVCAETSQFCAIGEHRIKNTPHWFAILR